MSDLEAKQLLDSACNKIGEHFDHVQILASRTVEGRTHSMYRGVGNWHARQGMAHEFIQNEVANENATMIAEKLRPPESQ